MSPTLEVGCRVVVIGDEEFGLIVDDFRAGLPASVGSTVVSDATFGRDWALTKRFAVALDSGRLVFRDDTELRPAPPNS